MATRPPHPDPRPPAPRGLAALAALSTSPPRRAATLRPRRGPGTDHEAAARSAAGVEGNARLTASIGAVIFLLLAAEGVTILSVGSLLAEHVFIGMMLIPPVLAKVATTGYRLARYYLGDPAYRRKGPPPALLRAVGPLIVVSTLVVLASGVALLYVPGRWRPDLLLLHKATFVVWFGITAIHVLGHLLETVKLAPRDWSRRAGPRLPAAGARRWALATALVLGLVLGSLVLGSVAPWLAWAAHNGAGH
jgi:hypothetical protein